MLGDDDHDRHPGGSIDQGPGRALARPTSERGYPSPYSTFDWYEEDLQKGGGLDLQKYLRILLRHWLIIVASLIVAVALGLAKTLLTTPIYTATVSLQIDKEAAKVVNMQSLEAPSNGTSDEFFQTQYALLKSRSLAEATAKDPRLDLARDAELLKSLGIISGGKGEKRPSTAQIQTMLTNAIQSNLSVLPVQRSRLVQLNFDSPSPRTSAMLANAVAENFIDTTLNRRLDSTSYARRFLQEQLATEKAKLEESERQLHEYARSQQIINISSPPPSKEGDRSSGSPASSAGGNQSLAASSLSAMSASLNEAKAATIKAEQRWRAAQSPAFARSADVQQNAVIVQMRQTKAKLEGEYQDALKTYQPNYDGMQQLRDRIQDADTAIDNEIKSLATSYQGQYQLALAEQRQLEGQVNSLTNSVIDLGGRSIKYDILQREIDTSRQLYDGLLQSYKEIGVAGNLGTNNISIIDRALPPGQPSKPEPLRIILTSIFLGLVVGVGLAVLLETLDESVRSPEDVEKKLGLPLLGTIPKLDKGTTPIVALADIRSNFSEAYYSVRTALQFSTNDGVPASIVVTSARPSEGKSTSSTAIAQHFARLGSRVLLIDSDLRNPSLHKVLNAENHQGFSNYLTGHMSLTQLAQETSIPGMFFIPCGPMPPNPAELLGSAKLHAMLREASSSYDLVLIDAPPVMGLADAPLLASAAAGTILVVEAGGTGRKLAKAAIRRLGVGNARLLGILLTKFDARKSSYGYGYGYAYEYDYGSRPAIKDAS